MLEHIELHNVLFLDIETVPIYPDYSELPEPFKALWDHKAGFIAKEPQTPYETYERAGIYAEFGKIVCISIGAIDEADNGKCSFRVKSFAGEDEVVLLENFLKLLNEHYKEPNHLLCAHNGKEFDFPFLSRRILINGLKLPKILNTAGKKPWQVPHLDTLELWKFGDYKHYSSLN
ncbi:MAG: ribonuclease H-like domain-containing protein, partial [Bacteroidetes bacterium]|nr:ribonuclease H-like domain-containing protein [Bacteroidota bacterium]